MASISDGRQSSAMSFAKVEGRAKVKLIKLSERDDALPAVKWSAERPKPFISPSLWSDEETADLEKYIDFHHRHPHCTSPRLFKDLPKEESGARMADPELPGMAYFAANLKMPPLPREFYTPMVGADADIDEVSTVAMVQEHKMVDSYVAEHEDPWYSMSVKDQLEQSHIDGSHTTVKTKAKKKPPQTAFDRELAWQQQMFGDYAGGGPKVTESHAQALADLALHDKSIVHPELGRKRVTPWARDYQFSKFTSAGEALKEYQQQQLEDRIANALKAYEEESTAIALAKSSRKSKKRTGSGKFVVDPDEFQDPYEVMLEKIGGTDRAETLSTSLQKLAVKVSKAARVRRKVVDTSLDLIEACDKLRVVKAAALMTANNADPNMLTAEEEPLFLHCLARLLRMDVITNSLHPGTEKRETSDRRRLQTILNLMLQHGAEINGDKGREGLRAIHLIAQANDTKAIVWLAKQKELQLDALSVREETSALMVATKYGHIEMVAKLVKLGAKVDRTDSKGRTALHHAALVGHTRVAQFLLRLGSQKLIKDMNGHTAAHLAQEGNYLACSQAIAAFATLMPSPATQLQFLTDLETRKKTSRSNIVQLHDLTQLFVNSATAARVGDAAFSATKVVSSLFKQLTRFLRGEATVDAMDEDDEAFLEKLHESEKKMEDAEEIKEDDLAGAAQQGDEAHPDAVQPFSELPPES